MVFAALYLAAIFVFAILYMQLPNGFYHSTVQYESVLDTDADRILDHLRAEVIARFEEEHGATVVDVGDWRLNAESIKLTSVAPHDSQVTVKVSAELEGTDELEGALLFEQAEVTFDIRAQFALGWPGDPQRTVFYEPRIEPESFSIPAETLFPRATGSLSSVGLVPLLGVSEALHSELVAFMDAVSGFPQAATGEFARMFYLSAVTITALGYGDIVPITNAARTAVAMETIVGVVLMGLFFNSLIKRRWIST